VVISLQRSFDCCVTLVVKGSLAMLEVAGRISGGVHRRRRLNNYPTHLKHGAEQLNGCFEAAVTWFCLGPYSYWIHNVKI
jgi:hypothetical protein